MVKSRHVPCTADDLRSARETLLAYQGRLTKSESGEAVLLLRVPRDTPDLVNDLDAALRLLPTKSAHEARHVVIVGDRDALTLSANALRPLVRARDDREAAKMDAFRREAPFAFSWFRFPGDPPPSTRLAVRLPVTHVGHLEDGDADAIAVALGPALDMNADRGSLCVYLVADDDHARLAPAEFLGEVRQRWAAAKQQVESLAHPRPDPEPEAGSVANVAPSPAPPVDVRARAEAEEEPAGSSRPRRNLGSSGPAEPEVPPGRQGGSASLSAASEKVLREFLERELAKRAAPVRRALPRLPASAPPSRFVFAYSEVIEAKPRAAAPPIAVPRATVTAPAAATAEAPPAGAPARASAWDAVKGEMRQMLVAAKYEVLDHPTFAGLAFAFAAAREGAEPEKVLVFTCDDLSPSLSRQVLAASRELAVDACVVLAPRVSVEAERNLVATKVSVYHPAQLSELSFG